MVRLELVVSNFMEITVHLFIERKNYGGVFMRVSKLDERLPAAPTGLLYVDHCVANVGWNQMNHWVNFYEDVMGFKNILSFDDNDISTEYSALMSKVMSSGNGYVKFPINEPAEGRKIAGRRIPGILWRRRSAARGAGDKRHSKNRARPDELRRRISEVPSSYYDELESRVGKIDEDIEPLKELGILVDRDNERLSAAVIFKGRFSDRPTLFFEIIQRKGAQSFGKGNFKALFEAIEREQEKRGNL